MSDLRSIPGVDRLLGDLPATPLPQPILTGVVRDCLDSIREEDSVPSYEDILARVQQAINRTMRTRLQPVINGTGVLIHTNLGRAPLGPDQCSMLAEIAGQYNFRILFRK